ncbi:uncharacterized protein LOC142326774 isoform X2 [Lycorma delicatula]|uniref:uncharacterized protein LOC142326774 isoform X2 n=1 Tax=Lycorma delicatula TaxID=130591 RepID=UPI003F50DBB1
MFSYVLAIYCIIFLMIYTTAIHKTDLLSNSSSLFKNNIINSKHCYFDDNTLLKDQTKLSKNNQLNCIHLQVTKSINQVLKDKRVDGRLMNDDNIFFKRKLLLEKTNIYNENKKKIMKNINKNKIKEMRNINKSKIKEMKNINKNKIKEMKNKNKNKIKEMKNINKNKIKEMKNIENNKQFKVTKSRKHLKKYSKNDKSEEYKKKIRLLRQKSALIEINREEEEMKSSKMILLSSEIKRIHSIELLNKRKQRKVFNKTLKKYLKRQKNVKNDRLKKNFSKIKKRYTLLWRNRRPYSQKKFSRLTLRRNKLYKRTFTKKTRYTMSYRKTRLPFSVRAHTRRKVSHHYTKIPYTKRTGTYASRSTYQRRFSNKYKKRFSFKRGTYRMKYKFQIITRKGFTKVKYQKKKMVYSCRRYRSMKPYTRIYYSRWRSKKIKGNIKKKGSKKKRFITNRKKNYTFSRRTIQNKSRRKVTKTSYRKKFFSRLSGYTKIRKSGTDKMQKINRKKTNYINKKIIT